MIPLLEGGLGTGSRSFLKKKKKPLIPPISAKVDMHTTSAAVIEDIFLCIHSYHVLSNITEFGKRCSERES